MGFRLPAAPTGEGITDEGYVLAHVRNFGAGMPGWPGTAVTIIPGVDPSVSVYESVDPYGDIPDHLDRRIHGGVETERQLLPAGELTSTRTGRVSALRSSLPAAHFFQGFANVRWSGVMEGYGLDPRPLVNRRAGLTQNFNLAAFGTKELHPATQYEPVPPMGSLIGYYGSNDKVL